MMRIRTYFIVLCCLLPFISIGQESEALSFVISGEVRDNANGKRLENVNITAPQRHLATVTNADGRFTLKTVSRPDYITVSHVGYKSSPIRTLTNCSPKPLAVSQTTMAINQN